MLFQKLSRKGPLLQLLNDRDHFLGQKFDIIFCFLFPVSDHLAWSLMILRKLQQLLHKWFFFIVLVKSYAILAFYVHLQCIMKKALFLLFLRAMLITYLITLSWEKQVIVLEKGPEKVFNFGSKNLYETCTLSCTKARVVALERVDC